MSTIGPSTTGKSSTGLAGFLRTLQGLPDRLALRRRSRPEIVQTTKVHLDRVLGSISEVVFSISPDGRAMHYISASVEKLYGVPASRFYSRPGLWRDVIHPHDRDAFELEVGRLPTTGMLDRRFRIVREDGKTVWLRCSAHYVIEETAEGAQARVDGILTNIDRLVRSEIARNKAESTLRLQHLALESSAGAVVILQLDPSSNQQLARITYCNPAFCRIVGSVKIEDLAGKALAETPVAASVRRRLAQLAERAREGSASQDWFAIPSGASGLVEVECLMSPVSAVPRAPISHVVGVLSDLTRRNETERALHLSRRALEAAVNGIAIADGSQYGHPIIQANASFGRIFGYEHERLAGVSLTDLLFVEGQQHGAQEVLRALRERRAASVTLDGRRHDSTPIALSVSISPVESADSAIRHFIVIIEDVTARRESERKVVDWAMRLDAVFSLSPDAFVYFDEVGRAVMANEAFRRISGIEPQAAVGMTADEVVDVLRSKANPTDLWAEGFNDFLLDDALGVNTQPLSADALTQEIRTSPVVQFHLSRPKPLVINATVRRYRGTSTASVLYLQDVTRDTEVERLKSEFLTTAAHELRTPMASLRGYSELLLTCKFDPETQREMLQTLHRQSVRMTTLLNDLLDLARIEARRGLDMAKEPVHLGELVGEVFDVYVHEGDERVPELELADDLPYVIGDRNKLQQALLNVVNNAYKYSPQGGAISIRTSREELEGRIFAAVEISDHGIGMTPEQCARAFERFYRASPSGNVPGTGLGLALVKEIVELHSGRVLLESHAGVGTRVKLLVPGVELVSAPARATALDTVPGS